jgi:hypothetical protein
MKKTDITPQVLEMLLENWGAFVTTGHWGPQVRTECGSIERQWNSDSSRYVWEGNATTPRKEANDALGIMIERLVSDMPTDHVRPLLYFYGYNKQPVQFAGLMRISSAMADSLLITAKSTLKQSLEQMGYE